MSKTILNFDDIEVKKSAFHKTKNPIDIDKIDIKNTVISNKISYGKKGFEYFIDCN